MNIRRLSSSPSEPFTISGKNQGSISLQQKKCPTVDPRVADELCFFRKLKLSEFMLDARILENGVLYSQNLVGANRCMMLCSKHDIFDYLLF